MNLRLLTSTKLFLAAALMNVWIPSFSQEVVTLWEDREKPYYKENSLKEHEEEMWGTRCLLDVTDPTLTIYRAEGVNSGKVVMIIPGGGYEIVAIHHEGYDLAKALSKAGITAAVLKYRIPNPESSDNPHLVPLVDARRALLLLRERSEFYGFDKSQVGLVGFSAGSHLSTVLDLWQSSIEEENPNFVGLIYGVTILSDENAKWLEQSLYHRKMTPIERKQNSLLELVSSETASPTFLVHAYDDNVCYVKESIWYAKKLRENNVETEMHLFQTGGHGFGMGRNGDGTDQWVPLFINWVGRL
jgi:acetyl esterase/lipase